MPSSCRSAELPPSRRSRRAPVAPPLHYPAAPAELPLLQLPPLHRFCRRVCAALSISLAARDKEGGESLFNPSTTDAQ
uniref:Uncharacterized protein n=1 Tax=Oryza barthii TaxID=65489 RepID=A0A0D3FD30_9ORYZ